jgi:cell wall-associated NlpC family hydrolase
VRIIKCANVRIKAVPMRKLVLYIGVLWLMACQRPERNYRYVPMKDSSLSHADSFPALADSVVIDSTIKETTDGEINTGNVAPSSVVAFAQTLMGVPYKYASTDPQQGFDCSGFITYVFNHFNIHVPRSSIDFTNAGREVPAADARPGDLILFTGTDSTIPVVGHMGIVLNNENGELEFIHSSSGKAHGVTTNPLKGYYQTRFVKVIRVFP